MRPVQVSWFIYDPRRPGSGQIVRALAKHLTDPNGRRGIAELLRTARRRVRAGETRVAAPLANATAAG